MTISEETEAWIGLPVKDYEPGKSRDFADTLYRLRIEWESGVAWPELFARFIAEPGATEATGISAGMWSEEMYEDSSRVVVQTLVTARDSLPNLKAIFVGDMTFEENEISWIIQSDLSPLLTAYPNLEHLRVRGGNELTLGTIKAQKLKSLTIETGGLPSTVLTEVAEADLPELEHLELWLGDDGYGWDGTVADVASFLEAENWPRLKYLGLCNSMISDEIATALASASILEQLDVLDLSRGTLSDEGARDLLKAPALKELKKLDLHHHYLSPAIQDEFKALGIDVDLREVQEPDEYDGELNRYVAVSE